MADLNKKARYKHPVIIKDNGRVLAVRLNDYGFYKGDVFNERTKDVFLTLNKNIKKKHRNLIKGIFSIDHFEEDIKNLSDDAKEQVAKFAHHLLNLNREQVIELSDADRNDLLDVLVEAHRYKNGLFYDIQVIENTEGKESSFINIQRFANELCFYLKQLDETERLKNIVLQEKHQAMAVVYCSEIAPDPEVRQIVLESKDPQWALTYILRVSDDDDMRQVIAESNDIDLAIEYLRHVKSTKESLNDETIKKEYPNIYQAIEGNLDVSRALRYCNNFGANPRMRQIILEEGEPFIWYSYCKNITDDDEIRQKYLKAAQDNGIDPSSANFAIKLQLLNASYG